MVIWLFVLIIKSAIGNYVILFETFQIISIAALGGLLISAFHL